MFLTIKLRTYGYCTRKEITVNSSLLNFVFKDLVSYVTPEEALNKYAYILSDNSLLYTDKCFLVYIDDIKKNVLVDKTCWNGERKIAILLNHYYSNYFCITPAYV